MLAKTERKFVNVNQNKTSTSLQFGYCILKALFIVANELNDCDHQPFTLT